MNNRSQPWQWVPSLYFVEGIPYLIVNVVALLMYKRFGLSDKDCAIYASWLSLPWVIKPLWSPIVEIFKSKRWWIVVMEMVMAALGGHRLHASHTVLRAIVDGVLLLSPLAVADA